MNRTLPERIFICGFMGAGKTTLGKLLAHELEVSFVDLDGVIEKEAGRSIAAIFENEGEAAFRHKEKRALLQIIRTQKGVIALGGGTLHNQHLLDHVKINGLLVFVNTPMVQIMERIMRTKNRPLLMNESGKMKSKLELQSEMQSLYKERLPLYEQAEVTIKTEDFDSVNAMVAQMVKKIRYHVALH